MMLSLLVMRRRSAGRRPSRPSEPEAAKFTPQAVRVLTSAEREAFKLLTRTEGIIPALEPAHALAWVIREAPSLAGQTVLLAQVPLTRFLRVQGKQGDWVRQANGLSADLLLCDAGSRVLVVVNVRSSLASEKSRRRNDSMLRLLKAAGIKVLSWSDAAMPDLPTVRNQLFAVLRAGGAVRSSESTSRPMPLIPVAEILEEGDSGAQDAMEPVPSALFDELEPDLPLPGKR